MIHLKLPDDDVRPLTFYLAMEEWAARVLPPAEYFFCWRVEPTVICGRNQDIRAEVDLDYCRANGIHVVRRRSGGGAVFADMRNFMFSYITSSDAVQTTFERYTSMVADMLGSLGIAAHANGRNDIVVDGRKIAGNAFYHLPGRSIVHGTMLYGLDLRHFEKALTPSRAKLLSKGVQSVPMRLTCLTEHGLTMSPEEFGRYALDHLTDSTREVSDAEIADICIIEQSYHDPQFLFGRHKEEYSDATVRTRRFEGVGEITATLAPDSNGILRSLMLSGDFFLTGDPDAEICRRLAGTPYTRAALEGALEEIDTGAVIHGLGKRQLLDLLID